MNKFRLITLSILAVLVLAACGNSDEKKITVGAKNFTEQFVLATMTTIMLEENGFTVDEKSNMGSTALRQALENKQVDITWDYTGTGLVTYLGEEPEADKQKAYEKVNEIDQNENDIIWINLAEANNTYTLMMRESHAEELGIESLSDLAKYMNDNDSPLSFATDAEFANRADGLPGVEDVYGFSFKDENVHEMSIGLNYDALRDEEVETSVGFATDARIDAFEFINLEDDLNFFPSYNAAVAMTVEAYEEYPEIEEILKPLADVLTDDSLREINYLVDIEDKSVREVAENFLEEHGLIN